MFPKRNGFKEDSGCVETVSSSYEEQRLKHRIFLLEQQVKELKEQNYQLQRDDWGTCIYLMEKYEKCFVCENDETGTILETKVLKS
jgi:hypothetical protein